MFKTPLKMFVTGFKPPKKPICFIDANYDYIWDEIKHQDKIEFERDVSGNSDEE